LVVADQHVASPIQVVLNADAYVNDWNRQGFGNSTDFFAGRDGAYVAHKKALLRQVVDARDVLSLPDQHGFGFLKVSMRTEALAKSHRPLKALFRPDRATVVGADAQGELIISTTPAHLDEIASMVANSEENTRYKEQPQKDKSKPTKMKPNPSRSRSEVGAIANVALWDAADRRQFSVQQSVEWLSDARTGGFYLLELFEAPVKATEDNPVEASKRQLFRSFLDLVAALGPGLRIVRVPLTDVRQALFAVWLLAEPTPTELQLDAVRSSALPPARLDLSAQRHQAVLQQLDRHPLVKRIHLPPIVTRPSAAVMASAAMPSSTWQPVRRLADRTYPRVGVVDGGFAACLDEWVIDRWNVIAPADESLDHATFIGGLLVGGMSMNAAGVANDPDGCDLVDVKVLPRESDPNAFTTYYGRNGALGFFQELNDAVEALRRRANVRIFNLSANFQTMADPTRYNPLTAQLDNIAMAHDVLFVVSAGNAEGVDCRQEWPEDPVTAMAILAGATGDRVRSPAESVRNISVGALNPPHLSHVLPHAPAAYSRRGPGLAAGLKPDVAHVGGANTPDGADHGLWSLHPNGHLCSSCGTSYAAPLVAKTLATLAHGIEGDMSRETLTALLLHHAHLPASLTNPAYGRVARHMVGFGLPQSAEQILEGASHQFTMVFSGRLKAHKQLAFSFAWPPCLSLPGGKCRGFAQMTLVSTPPIDPNAGSELVRVELQAHLNQEGKSGAHASCGWLPTQPGDEHHREVRLIADALKWSPVKIYQWRSPDGQGKSTNWTLKVDHLARDDQSMPDEGVPFTVLVTIGDPDGEQPVFQEMRQWLQVHGVKLEQIQTAARVTQRV
jgi:hypothetical protein